MNAPIRISSAANPLVKQLKGLHAKKGRAESGLFLAEGARLAAEAADLGVWPEVMAVSPAALERAQVRKLVEEAARRGARTIETSETLLAQISRRDNPQTVIGAYRQRLAALEDIPVRADALVVALEGVRDPGNFGTIVRTADSVGADAVVLIGQTCDPYSVEAVRATMGSIFAMPVARAPFDVFNAWRHEHCFSMAGASLKGALGPDAPNVSGPFVLLMGNEQSGLPEEMERACDTLVRLPMKGRADSLNLAIATGVLLYDIWRRRGYAGARA